MVLTVLIILIAKPIMLTLIRPTIDTVVVYSDLICLIFDSFIKILKNKIW